jgi:hypothetical protein
MMEWPLVMGVELTGSAPSMPRGRRRPAFEAAGRLARIAPAHPIALLAAACVAAAALSLLLPSAPTYDPFSWLIWGREITHLDLRTSEGPSWKPLPVAITTLFAPTGSAAPWLWLVVARTGGLMALAGSYRVAARIAGRPAGLIAAASLILSREWMRDSWLGNSEGIVLGLLLFGVERHLAGNRRQALVLGFLAALLRPEVWPFLGLYGLWLWFRDPALRRLSLVLAALILLLWFVPEWIGSGDPFRAAARAKIPAPGSKVPALSPHPVRVLLEDSKDVLIKPALWGGVIGLLFCLWRPRRLERTTLVMAAWALAWLAVVAAMTAHGYSGNPRYLIAPGGLACVVAGVGWARLGGAIAGRVPAPRVLVGAVLALALVGVSLHYVRPRVTLLKAEAKILRHEARITSGLSKAIARAGGAKHLRACGTPYTGPFQVPRVAWDLHIHIDAVGLDPVPPGVVFQAPLVPGSPPVPMQTSRFRPVASAGLWRVFASCGSSPSSG